MLQNKFAETLQRMSRTSMCTLKLKEKKQMKSDTTICEFEYFNLKTFERNDEEDGLP